MHLSAFGAAEPVQTPQAVAPLHEIRVEQPQAGEAALPAPAEGGERASGVTGLARALVGVDDPLTNGVNTESASNTSQAPASTPPAGSLREANALHRTYRVMAFACQLAYGPASEVDQARLWADARHLVRMLLLELQHLAQAAGNGGGGGAGGGNGSSGGSSSGGGASEAGHGAPAAREAGTQAAGPGDAARGSREAAAPHRAGGEGTSANNVSKTKRQEAERAAMLAKLQALLASLGENTTLEVKPGTLLDVEVVRVLLREGIALLEELRTNMLVTNSLYMSPFIGLCAGGAVAGFRAVQDQLAANTPPPASPPLHPPAPSSSHQHHQFPPSPSSSLFVPPLAPPSPLSAPETSSPVGTISWQGSITDWGVSPYAGAAAGLAMLGLAMTRRYADALRRHEALPYPTAFAHR